MFQMWACAKGHRETAILLYRWNHTALNVRNLSAQTATDCARSNRHEELAQEMERLEAAREKNNMTLIGKALNLCSVETRQVSVVKMETNSCGSHKLTYFLLRKGGVIKNVLKDIE